MTLIRISSGDDVSVTMNSRRSGRSAVRNPPSLIKLYGKLGRLGKEKMRITRLFSLCLLLYGCGAGQVVTYTGQISPQSGTCDAAAPASLIKRGHYVQFAPREGILVLAGQAATDGAVQAHLDTPGIDRKPYHLALIARLNGETIAGTYVTPRCRYAVTLKAGG